MQSSNYLLRPCIHYFLHLGFPVMIAWFIFNKPKGAWKKAALILLSTMLIDLDHLLVTPIFDAHRASVGFHFLHSYPAILVYLLLFIFPKGRIVAVGLLLHIATDYLDYQLLIL